MSISILLKSILANDKVRRVLNTFWQAFLAAFLIGATGILSNVLSTHNFSDAKSALLALVVAALAAGLSALKNLTVARA